MRSLKKTLQLLFGLAHLAVIPLFLLGLFIDGDIFDAGLPYLPMFVPLVFSLVVIAYTMPHQIFLLLALPLPVILPALGSFTLGRRKLFYFLFVLIPHIINTAIVCSMMLTDPLICLVHIGYLALAITIVVMPD